jgi:hypothetical protein
MPSFPDDTIIARLAWRYTPSEENNKTFGRAQSFVAGAPVNGVQFMVKDPKKYASTGGWKFAQFDEGKPLEDEAKLKSCFDCHAAVKDRDLVFTVTRRDAGKDHLARKRHSSAAKPMIGHRCRGKTAGAHA